MHPTGEAARLEVSSYVATEGFGHEEWLLDTAWLLSGYRGSTELYSFGFLQPIGKYRAKYIGKTLDICLYTVDPDKTRLAVGIIRSVYVPDDDELAWVLREYRRNGRLQKMESDLQCLGVRRHNFAAIGGPASIANVRFRSDNIEIFEPRRTFPRSHVVNRMNRYHPFNWDDISAPAPASGETSSLTVGSASGQKERSEELRRRAAIAATVYSPEHARLQNAMGRWLKANYGGDNVFLEENFVDLKLKTQKGFIFFEIKTALTAKGCIREAVGQLLEYGHYAKENRATRLVVVGAALARPDDKIYLDQIRRLYSLPIGYQRWSWETNSLDPEL